MCSCAWEEGEGEAKIVYLRIRTERRLATFCNRASLCQIFMFAFLAGWLAGRWTPGQCGKVAASCRKFGFGADKSLYSVKMTVPNIKVQSLFDISLFALSGGLQSWHFGFELQIRKIILWVVFGRVLCTHMV